MIRAHNKAVYDLLTAALPPAPVVVGGPNVPRVFTGKAPNQPPPLYVVLYGDTGTPDAYAMAARSKAHRWTVSTLYVGSTENEAWWVAEKAQTALLGARLTVAGRSCTPMRKQSGRPVSVDPDDETVFSGSDVWTFASVAAA